VEIPSTRTEGEANKFTLYVIMVKWLKSGETWTESHRFSSFSRLHKTMSEVFQGIPALPPKTWGFTKNLDKEFVEKRRKGLEKYLQTIIKLEGVMNTVSLVEFLGIPEHVKLTQSSVPIEISKIEERQFGINQFIFDTESHAVLTANEEVKLLNRFDAHLSNLRMPWEAQGCISPVGSFSCWKRGRKGLWHLLGTQFYDCPISKIAWDPKTRIVYSALGNGDIAGYSVDMDASGSSSAATGEDRGTRHRAFKLKYEVKALHAGRILCMHLTLKDKRLVTTGQDKRFRVLDIESQKVISEVTTKGKLTALVVEEEENRAIAAGSENKIFIINMNSDPSEIVMELNGHTSQINALHYFRKQRYLFSGGRDYCLGLWNVKNSRDVLMSDKIGFLKRGPPTPITKICYIEENKIIITGHEKGFVAVWDAQSGRITMVFRAHRTYVTDLKWVMESHILLTASHGCIRFWQFPRHMQLCRAVEAKDDFETKEVEVVDYEKFVNDTKSTLEEESAPQVNGSVEPKKDDKPPQNGVEGEASLGGFFDEDIQNSDQTNLLTPNQPDGFLGLPTASKDPKTSKTDFYNDEEEVRETKASSFMSLSKRIVTEEPEPEPEPKAKPTGEKTSPQVNTADLNADLPDASSSVEVKEKEEQGNNVTTPSEVEKVKKVQVNKVVEPEEEVDIFAAPKNDKRQETIEKFSDLFGIGTGDDGSEAKKAISNLFGEDDDDDIFGEK